MATEKCLKMKIPFKKSKNGILIEVKVEPRSSQRKIVGLIDNILKVKLTAPPVSGAANDQLIEVLAKETGVNKSSIRITQGQRGKKKVVEITGISEI
jgi:uncharacterized protein (TIGR00251 family)